MLNLNKEIEGAKTIGISGHIRPDGDCVGSTMALYLYLKKTRPDIDVHIFLEKPADIFSCIKDIDKIEDAENRDYEFDIFFALDCGKERLGAAEHLFDAAKRTVNIDHHVSNPGTGDYNYIDPNASSASELIYDLVDLEKIDADIALALYIGIIHDTGVMQYSNTQPKTLVAVSKLIGFGFDFPAIIQETFYQKSFLQYKLSGVASDNAKLLMDGKVSVSHIDLATIEECGASSHDFDGIVNQLLNVKGVDVSIFMYELPTGEYKVSLRSNGTINVARVTENFGGGGHVRAAGCTVKGSFSEVTDSLTANISAQYKELM